jgi:predicted HTH domain antitoxin
MGTISVRLDEQTLKDLEMIREDAKADRSEIIRRLLDKALKEAKLEKAMELLRKQETSIGKASEIAGVTIYEIIEAMKKYGVHIGYTVEDLRRDMKRFK